MPRLACRSCGRQIFSEAPPEALLEGDLRCPRCGAYLNDERRERERRHETRRQNPEDDPGPVGGDERRGAERRVVTRRRETQ